MEAFLHVRAMHGSPHAEIHHRARVAGAAAGEAARSESQDAGDNGVAAAAETITAPRTRRRAVTLTSSGALATLLAACGTSAGSGGARGAGIGAPQAAPVELAAWSWYGNPEQQQALQQMSDELAAQTPPVKVQWAFQGPSGADALQKLQVAKAGGQPPEVAMMQEAWIPLVGTDPSVLVLDPYLKQAKYDLSDFTPALKTYMQFGDGKVRYLPWYIAPVALHYNVGAFRDAGIAGAPASWDQLVGAARLLVRSDGSQITRSGVDLGTADWVWLPILWGTGGEFDRAGTIAQNSQLGVDALQFLADLVLKHRVQGVPAPAGGFNAGAVAMTVDGSWNVKVKRQQSGLDFATAPIPQRMGGSTAHPLRMEGMFGFTKKGKDDATWRYFQHITSAENTARFSILAGFVPGRASARKSKAFADQVAAEPAWKAFLDTVEAPNAKPMPMVRNWLQIKPLIARMIGEAQKGERSPKVLLDDYTQQIQQLIAS